MADGPPRVAHTVDSPALPDAVGYLSKQPERR